MKIYSRTIVLLLIATFTMHSCSEDDFSEENQIIENVNNDKLDIIREVSFLDGYNDVLIPEFAKAIVKMGITNDITSVRYNTDEEKFIVGDLIYHVNHLIPGLFDDITVLDKSNDKDILQEIITQRQLVLQVLLDVPMDRV